MLVPFAAKSSDNALRSAGERLLNYFLHPSEGPSTGVLYAVSGTVSKAELGGAVRAVARIGETLYIAAAGHLWSWDGTTATELADIPDGPTRIAASATAVGMVIGETYYLWKDSALTQPDLGSLDTPVDIAEIANYFVLVGTGNGRSDLFVWTADGETFDGLDFATAEASADALVGVASNRSELWLMGTQTTQIMYLSGDAAAPFAPNRAASLENGCVSAASIVQDNNAVYWVDEKHAIWASGGGSPTKISTAEIEIKLQASGIASSFAFSDRNHRFVAFRNADFVICYDLTTGLWSERTRGAGHDVWSACCSGLVGGVEYLGTDSGGIVTLSQSSFTDGGEIIVGEAVSAPVVQSDRRFKVPEFVLRFNSGQYSLDRQPKVILQTTTDGRKWSEAVTAPLGNRGEYYSRVSFRRLGQFRRFQAKIRISDPVQRDIEGVVINGISTS